MLGYPDPSTYLALGDSYAFLHQYDQAISAYQSSMKNLPSDRNVDVATSQLDQRIGESYVLEKQYSNAIPVLQKSLQLSSPNDQVTYYLGIAYTGAGQKSEAMQIYQQLLRSNKALAQQLYNAMNGADAAKSGSTASKP